MFCEFIALFGCVSIYTWRKKHGNHSILFLLHSLGYENIAKLLIDNGADLNKKDLGNAPIHLAVQKGSFWLCLSYVEPTIKYDKLILSRKYVWWYKEYFFIFISNETGHINIVKLLVDNNVDVNQSDSLHQTALHLASEQGKLIQFNLFSWCIQCALRIFTFKIVLACKFWKKLNHFQFRMIWD